MITDHTTCSVADFKYPHYPALDGFVPYTSWEIWCYPFSERPGRIGRGTSLVPAPCFGTYSIVDRGPDAWGPVCAGQDESRC